MHFEVDQHIDGPIASVAGAFADAAYYETMGDTPKLGRPEVLGRRVESRPEGEVVHLQVRYRFTGDLSSAVTAVIDRRRLTWVEETTHDLTAHTVHFVLLPDHYSDRLRCSGGASYRADGSGTVRHISGDLKVRAPLVAGAVEGAIVSGLREHLESESGLMARFLRAHAT